MMDLQAASGYREKHASKIAAPAAEVSKQVPLLPVPHQKDDPLSPWWGAVIQPPALDLTLRVS